MRRNPRLQALGIQRAETRQATVLGAASQNPVTLSGSTIWGRRRPPAPCTVSLMLRPALAARGGSVSFHGPSRAARPPGISTTTTPRPRS